MQLLGRGRALLLRGRVEAAKKAAQEVLQQAPEHADALCLLGQCFAAADDRMQVLASSLPQHGLAEQQILQSKPDPHKLAKLWGLCAQTTLEASVQPGHELQMGLHSTLLQTAALCLPGHGCRRLSPPSWLPWPGSQATYKP